jgi:hypothetical protein
VRQDAYQRLVNDADPDADPIELRPACFVGQVADCLDTGKGLIFTMLELPDHRDFEAMGLRTFGLHCRLGSERREAATYGEAVGYSRRPIQRCARR